MGTDARSRWVAYPGFRVSHPCSKQGPAAILDRVDTRSESRSAGRRVAALVAALTIAANVGTSYVMFASDFLSRFREGPASLTATS